MSTWSAVMTSLRAPVVSASVSSVGIAESCIGRQLTWANPEFVWTLMWTWY